MSIGEKGSQKKAVRYPGAEVSGSYEPPDVAMTLAINTPFFHVFFALLFVSI